MIRRTPRGLVTVQRPGGRTAVYCELDDACQWSRQNLAPAEVDAAIRAGQRHTETAHRAETTGGPQW